MASLDRRILLLASLATPALLSRPAWAAEFTYKYANNLPATHPMNLRAAEAVAKIKEETGGRVEIQIFPTNQLGSDTDVLSQVRSGAVEFFTLSGLILSTLVPQASINGVGFAFPDYASVWKAMDGALGAHVRAQIGKAGLMVMDNIWDNGFRQMTSSPPIAHQRGRRTWTELQDPRAGQPTLDHQHVQGPSARRRPACSFSEVYSALQTQDR